MKNSTERSSGAGFTNWNKKARELGLASLADLTASMDSHSERPGVNAHRAIAEDLEAIGLPIQDYVAVKAQGFLDRPEYYLSKVPHGDYYFVSVIPGIHLAHESDTANIVEFVSDYLNKHPESDPEIYISHNGEPVMSGHIIVKDDMPPNTVHAEFTIGNFNDFHRGFATPEVTLHRPFNQFEWKFLGKLALENSSTKVESNSGVKLTRREIAQRALSAIKMIPHHDDHYLPGYYEVLLERSGETTTRAAFIEANLDYRM